MLLALIIITFLVPSWFGFFIGLFPFSVSLSLFLCTPLSAFVEDNTKTQLRHDHGRWLIAILVSSAFLSSWIDMTDANIFWHSCNPESWSDGFDSIHTSLFKSPHCYDGGCRRESLTDSLVKQLNTFTDAPKAILRRLFQVNGRLCWCLLALGAESMEPSSCLTSWRGMEPHPKMDGSCPSCPVTCIAARQYPTPLSREFKMAWCITRYICILRG
jgi:hypothetical protein